MLRLHFFHFQQVHEDFRVKLHILHHQNAAARQRMGGLPFRRAVILAGTGLRRFFSRWSRMFWMLWIRLSLNRGLELTLSTPA